MNKGGKLKIDINQRRNTKNIGFSETEYAEIVVKAKKSGLLPRQQIMFDIRRKK